MTIAEQIKNITSSLPTTTRLIAVSKTKPAEDIQEAYNAGQRVFGENKALEMRDKHEALPKDIEWHFIGHLQTNKVKDVIDRVEMIESVHSLKLAKEISRLALKNGKKMNVLLEVNIGEEESKSGFRYNEVLEAVKEIALLDGVSIKGLMAIPPICDTNEAKEYFTKMQKLFIDIKDKNIDNVNMEYLSMGMSDTYSLAIECGANLVRVGTLLFGKRNYF